MRTRWAVQYFSLTETAAEQAGWRTTDGVSVGMSARDLEDLYATAEGARSGRPVPLLQMDSEYGDAGFMSVLEVRLRGGGVSRIDGYAGPGGE